MKTNVREKKHSTAARILWLCVGCLFFALGALGAVIPIIPTVPFLLVAGVAFAKSSARLHAWFVNTKLYKSNLESYVQGRGMSIRAKVRIMLTVTALMAVGCFIMLSRGIYTPCIVLGFVWLFHLVYFIFGVKTVGDSDKK